MNFLPISFCFYLHMVLSFSPAPASTNLEGLGLVAPGSMVSAASTLTVRNYGRLEELYARAQYEQGCDGGKVEEEQVRLKRRYDQRFQAVRSWFRSRYLLASLNSAVDEAFGNPEHVMVGSCRMRDGEAVMPDTHAFITLLRRDERGIAATKRGL